MEMDVVLTKAEIARYNFYHIRWLLLIDLLGLIGLVVLTYLSVFNPSPQTRDMLSSLLIWAVLLLAAGLSQPFILLLQIYILKNPAMQVQTARRNYRFDNDGIHIESNGKRVLTPWGRIVKVKDIGRLILIFTGPKMAYVIPKRCFSSGGQVNSFEGFVIEMVRSAN